MLHTIATMLMLGVGLTLLVFYFIITSGDHAFKISDEDKEGKSVAGTRFNNAMAGILSLGSMFMAFSIAVLTLCDSRKLSEMEGTSTWKIYMLFMLIIGIILIALASTAIAQLKNADDVDQNDPNSSARGTLVVILVLSCIAVVISGGFGVSELVKKGPGFGFDFEF